MVGIGAPATILALLPIKIICVAHRGILLRDISCKKSWKATMLFGKDYRSVPVDSPMNLHGAETDRLIHTDDNISESRKKRDRKRSITFVTGNKKK
jgi:hypothetical protein